MSSHCAAYGGPVFRRCALRVLAPPALRASNGQRPGRECIFTANASICSAKNARNDVHAVISDLSLVLPILCQCSENAWRRSKIAATRSLIVDKPAVCQRDFPIACLRTASRASTASNRDGNVFFRFAPPCASLARCSVPAHFVCSALQPFGPSPFCKAFAPEKYQK